MDYGLVFLSVSLFSLIILAYLNYFYNITCQNLKEKEELKD